MNIKNHTNEKLHDISKVIENPKNPNKHSDSQIAMLSKIIEFQGWRIPIVVSNRSGFIVRGHGRLMSARKLGLEKVPVSFQDYESEAQEWADLIADNRIAELAEMDRSELKDIIDQLDTGEIDLDLTGFDQESLEDLMSEFFEPEEGLTDDDEMPEEVEPRCKPGDLWKLGEHRLMCGDSTSEDDVKKLIGDKKIDLIHTDPPYGINENCDRQFASKTRLAKGGKFKQIKGDENTNTAVCAFKIVQNLGIKNQVWWGANHYAHSVPESASWFVWDKRVDEKQEDANSDCELAWVNASWSSVRIFRHLWKGMIKASEHGEARVHPTQKPTALAEWVLDYYGDVKVVLDLFGGSGFNIIASEKKEVKSFTMEFDPHYCDVIIQRWEDFTGEKAEKIN